MNAPAKRVQRERSVKFEGERREPQELELYKNITLQHIDKGPGHDQEFEAGKYPYLVTRSATRTVWVLLGNERFGRPLNGFIKAHKEGTVAFYVGLEVGDVRQLEQLVE